MGFFSRIFGICRTKPPADQACWRYSNGRVEVNLAQAKELAVKGGAVRLEGRDLPFRLLVVQGEDGGFYAFRNQCTHMGRRLDPLPGRPQLECCSVSKSRYEYSGAKVSGPAKGPVQTLPVEREGQTLTIRL